MGTRGNGRRVGQKTLTRSAAQAATGIVKSVASSVVRAARAGKGASRTRSKTADAGTSVRGNRSARKAGPTTNDTEEPDSDDDANPDDEAEVPRDSESGKEDSDSDDEPLDVLMKRVGNSGTATPNAASLSKKDNGERRDGTAHETIASQPKDSIAVLPSDGSPKQDGPANTLPTVRTPESDVPETDGEHCTAADKSPEPMTPTKRDAASSPVNESIMLAAFKSKKGNPSAGQVGHGTGEDNPHDSGKEKKTTPYEADKTEKSRPKHEYVTLLSSHVPHLDQVFDVPFMARSTGIAFMKHVQKAVKKNFVHPQRFHDLMRDYVFTKKRHERKTVWRSHEGKSASSLKRRIMLCALVMARKDIFRRFRNTVAVEYAKEDKEEALQPLPSWLTATKNGKPSIDVSHIHKAVNHNESTVDSKADFARRDSIAKSGSPSRHDVGMFAMDILYHRLVQMFTIARKAVKEEFFNMVGYLFVDWTKYGGCPVHDSEVRLCWAAPLGASHLEAMNDGDTNDLLTVKYCVDDENRPEKNARKYIDFVRDREDVILLANHDILMRKDLKKNAVRRRLGNTRVQWCRAINLMDVLLSIFHVGTGMTREDDQYELLSSREDSISLLYTLARTLRVILTNTATRDVDEPCQEGDTSAGGDAEDSVNPAGSNGSTGGEKVNGLEAEKSPATESAGAAEDMEAEEGTPTGPHIETVAKRFLDLLMPIDRSTEHKLTQVTCTVEESTYWAEHIRPPPEDGSVMDDDHVLGPNDSSARAPAIQEDDDDFDM